MRHGTAPEASVSHPQAACSASSRASPPSHSMMAARSSQASRRSSGISRHSELSPAAAGQAPVVSAPAIQARSHPCGPHRPLAATPPRVSPAAPRRALPPALGENGAAGALKRCCWRRLSSVPRVRAALVQERTEHAAHGPRTRGATAPEAARGDPHHRRSTRTRGGPCHGKDAAGGVPPQKAPARIKPR